MGPFGRFGKSDVAQARSALAQAEGRSDGPDAVTAFIQRVLALGLDGKGFFKGAAPLADAVLLACEGDAERAVARLSGRGFRAAAAGGFLTSLGGFVTMPVAMPVNVLEFYVNATRTVGAIAHLRGYDLADPAVRTAVLLTLVGSRPTDILAKAGISVTSGAVGDLATGRLPPAARMMIHKAIGFRLLKMVGEQTLARFGRAVPFLGGFIGAAADAMMTSRITTQALIEFPPRVRAVAHDWGVR